MRNPLNLCGPCTKLRVLTGVHNWTHYSTVWGPRVKISTEGAQSASDPAECAKTGAWRKTVLAKRRDSYFRIT
jgi:hypothetical protein